MQITLKNSTMFGMTTQNLKIPEIQKFLATQGMRVSFPDAETAIIESSGFFLGNVEFQNQIKKLEQEYKNRPQEQSYQADSDIDSNLELLLIIMGALGFAVSLVCGLSFAVSLMAAILLSFVSFLIIDTFSSSKNTSYAM